MKPACFFLAGLSITLVSAWAEADTGDEAVDFATQIRPILRNNCTKCHGGVKQAADLSFIYGEQALDSGVIVPGDPDESELIFRVRSDDPELRMPPAGQDGEASAPLTAAEIDLLSRWIEQGARWGEHWAFQPPEDPPLPATRHGDWISQPLDAFVAARWDAEQLQPAAEAAPRQWLRRASFDLTGLPPTPKQTQRFLQACQVAASPRDRVYEQEVDRLMSSAHYGQRWAAMWMDLARYADTKGFEKDPHRDMWPYRDWLIRAFNQDMPFDRFTIKQLAGDLLERPTADDLVATAFHRNTQTNTEGGTDDEEFRVASVIDRINTTWTVWQATTFGCVQCHSHPFDPFRNEEYYQFMAFFNNTEDHDLDNDYPTLRLPRHPDQATEAVKRDYQLRSVRQELNQAGRKLAMDCPDWKPLAPELVETSHGKLAVGEGHEVRVAGGTFPPGCEYTVTAAAVPCRAIRIEILPESDDPRAMPETGSVVSKFEIALASPEGQPQPMPIREVFADHLAGPYDPRQAVRDGAAGFGGYPKLFGPRWAVFVLEDPVAPPEGSSFVVKLHQDAQTTGSRAVHVRRFSLSASNLPEWTELVDSPQRKSQWKALRELAEQSDAPEATTLPVMRERHWPGARPTRRFVRGNWLEHGELVTPGTPAVLPPMACENPTRLELAEWLVSDNPLSARVLANRLWAQLFGIGIVETLEDFGSTGTPPSHPALLDHLACRLQHTHRWHLKPFLKELVLSSTYRQSSRTTAALRETDPQNRLLARGPRTRLSAEMIRDQALTVSGLLTARVGGPSVMPPQPDGVWKTVYNNAQWETAVGPDRYRRALYTYWRRTSPYPSFLSFDAPTREFCTARRVHTNSPLQALVTLNDPVYMECAQALARRARQAAGKDPPDWIRWAFEATTQQEPSDPSAEQLQLVYQAALEEYRDDVPGVHDLVDNAEDYAMTIVASTILNLDQALVK